MKQATLNKVMDLISAHDNVFELREINRSVLDRIKTLQTRKGHESRSTIHVGDTVQVVEGVKPKYLVGFEGKVVSLSIKFCHVQLPIHARLKRRSGRPVGIPWACVEKRDD